MHNLRKSQVRRIYLGVIGSFLAFLFRSITDKMSVRDFNLLILIFKEFPILTNVSLNKKEIHVKEKAEHLTKRV